MLPGGKEIMYYKDEIEEVLVAVEWEGRGLVWGSVDELNDLQGIFV